MPERLAEFFVKACSPQGGVVIDPFAGSGTTVAVSRRLAAGPAAGDPQSFVDTARERLRRTNPTTLLSRSSRTLTGRRGDNEKTVGLSSRGHMG